MSASSPPIASTFSNACWPLAMAVALVIAACSPLPDSPGSTATLGSVEDPARPPAHAGLGLEELRKRGRDALRDRRIYAPAGNNAMEYYIALHDGSKGGDESAANALAELQPYAVIAAEQALGRQDFIEAERLRKLLAAADPRAPSLARIASAITRSLLAQTQSLRTDNPATGEAETRVTPVPANASTGPSAADQVRAPIPAPAISPPVIAPVAAAPRVTLAAAVDSRTSAPVATRQPDAPPAETSRRVELVAVRTPQPEYPADRRQKGAVGQVLASFTVNSDGTVGEVRTESIGSRHISFERSVMRAVKRWKYRPPGEARSVTQSFSFAP